MRKRQQNGFTLIEPFKAGAFVGNTAPLRCLGSFSRICNALDDKGTVRESPFLVVGKKAVRAFKLMFSHRRDNNSPRRIAVASASFTMGLTQWLRRPIGSNTFKRAETSASVKTRPLAGGLGGLRTICTGFGTLIPHSRRAWLMIEDMYASSLMTVPALTSVSRSSRNAATRVALRFAMLHFEIGLRINRNPDSSKTYIIQLLRRKNSRRVIFRVIGQKLHIATGEVKT